MVLLIAFGSLLTAASLAYAWAYRREGRSNRVIALLYHRLVPEDEFRALPPMNKNFCIPEGRFREHLGHLRARGYSPVSLDEVVDAIEHDRALPPHSVLITFDDGCESVYSKAFPILQDLRFRAACFVTTDPGSWVFREGPDAQRRMTEEEIRELASAGIAIGSHALTHDPLQTMSPEQIENELLESKRYLERVTGQRLSYFAVPLNWYGYKVRATARKLGYRAVCTSDPGTIQPDSDLYHLRRLNIEGWMTAEDLDAHLRPGTIVQRQVIQFFKRFPARVLGPRIWLPFRAWIFASPIGPLLSLKNLRRVLFAGVVLIVGLALAVSLLAAP
jgi:peptidoglycan/xylan/chitin deacetylase (PgdA/CDA1 family)